MASFGTPVVIGTLSSPTSQTTYTVPITATSGLGDSIIVIAGSQGGGANNTVASITDSQGQTTYQQVLPPVFGSGTLNYWQIFNSKILTSSDTISVTFPVANTFLKNIIVIDCPGVPTSPLAIDALSVGSFTGGTGTVTAFFCNITSDYELLILAEQNANAGGTPTVTNATSLATLHSGSNEYTNASYIILGTKDQLSGFIATWTTTESQGWGTSGVAYFPYVPVFNQQYPFPLGIQPPSIAFNPSIRLIPPLPQIPNVVPLSNVNVTGVVANVSANATFADANELIYTNFNPTFQLQPTGIPYPLFMNGVLQFLPRQIPTASQAVFQAGTIGTVLVSAPSGSPNIIQPFFPQYPFQANFPFNLNFNPSLTWLRPQTRTAGIQSVVDGGQPSQVTVNAQFSDMAAVVSVSATQNVAVVAQTPVGTVSGVTANVNVVAQNGTIVETLTGVVTGVNVVAVSGSVKVSPQGTAANVTVAVPSGQVVTISQQGTTARVNVTMAGDNIVVASLGTTANISVASTGAVQVSPQGTIANVNVVAQAGILAWAIPGSAANVNVASTGAATDIIPGTAASVSVSALAGVGSETKGPAGVTANVSVSSSGIVTISFPGITAPNITVSAIPGSVGRSLAGTTANVSVVATSGLDGHITITGTLVNPDLADDLLLSGLGKLLDDPVTNRLVSATPPPRPQGI